MDFQNRRPVQLAALCTLSALFLGLLQYANFNPLTKTEAYLADLRTVFGRKTPASTAIVFLTIDQASVQLDQLFPEEITASPELSAMKKGWPWSRQVYAALLDRLSGASAKVVLFDLIFPTSAAGDDAFRAALDRHRDQVIICGNFQKAEAGGASTATLSLPCPTLLPRDEVPDSRLAFANFLPDADGVVRRAHYRFSLRDVSGIHSDQASYESPSAAALRKLHRSDLIPKTNSAPFRYTGPPGTFPSHSVYELFVPSLWKANFADGGFFKDKIVVIGPSGSWSHDEHTTLLVCWVGLIF